MPFLRKDEPLDEPLQYKNRKTDKEKFQKKNLKIVGIKINYFILNFFNFVLLFAVLTRGRRVQYGNVVVQQPLVSSVISAACVSIAAVYICNKVVDSIVG